ncbi:hypothetical protein MKX01_034628 [Papaver californicum]|nr:hypothetical protein MKX01_034628 [Papaver californicum]
MDSVKEDFGLQLTSRMERNEQFWPSYQALLSLIQEETDNIALSDKFSQILSEVEGLHRLATTPKEQVLDAQLLLDFVNKLSLSIKFSSGTEISPADFITILLGKYGENSCLKQSRSFKWNELGEDVCGLCGDVSRCCSTMVGPMDVEAKKKKVVVKKRKRELLEVEHPEDLNSAATEGKAETDKSIATMFKIMKIRKKPENVEDVIMNRNSFAQTVENLFALSFLVKEGRAEMKIDGDGHQVLSLRNAPCPDVIKSGELQYKHFFFRIDHKDWSTMKDLVAAGNEVMPHRNSANTESTPHGG